MPVALWIGAGQADADAQRSRAARRRPGEHRVDERGRGVQAPRRLVVARASRASSRRAIVVGEVGHGDGEVALAEVDAHGRRRRSGSSEIRLGGRPPPRRGRWRRCASRADDQRPRGEVGDDRSRRSSATARSAERAPPGWSPRPRAASRVCGCDWTRATSPTTHGPPPRRRSCQRREEFVKAAELFVVDSCFLVPDSGQTVGEAGAGARRALAGEARRGEAGGREAGRPGRPRRGRVGRVPG